MNEAKGRRIAWFLHRPLFLESPDEGDTGYLSVEPQSRAHLLDLVKCYSVALVASGHLHKAHEFRHDGTHYIWEPSPAFLIVPEMKPPPMPRKNPLGAVVYEFANMALQAAIATVPGLISHWIDYFVTDGGLTLSMIPRYRIR